MQRHSHLPRLWVLDQVLERSKAGASYDLSTDSAELVLAHGPAVRTSKTFFRSRSWLAARQLRLCRRRIVNGVGEFTRVVANCGDDRKRLAEQAN